MVNEIVILQTFNKHEMKMLKTMMQDNTCHQIYDNFKVTNNRK